MDDEAALVSRAKHDPHAFGVLYDRYVDRIYRYLLSRTGNVQVAEDLTAETFLAALKSLWRFRWTGKPFIAWLYRIALAQIGEFYRQQRRVPTVALELAAELPGLKETPELLTDDYGVLHQTLEQLPRPQYEAIVLKYFEDLPIAEIAWVMRLPSNTIKSHLRRGLLRLRELIDSPYAANQPAKPRGAFAPRGATR